MRGKQEEELTKLQWCVAMSVDLFPIHLGVSKLPSSMRFVFIILRAVGSLATAPVDDNLMERTLKSVASEARRTLVRASSLSNVLRGG